MTSSISLVNVGTSANDGTGDSIRKAFQTTNNNWSFVTSYTITTATNNGQFYANTGARKFVLNGTGTVANVWINLPSTGSDGQEMMITSLVPITSCFVNQNGQPIKWLANNFAASGNATTRITYTTTNNSWMTF